MWWRREAPSQLRDVKEVERKPPRGMPFSISSSWQGCQAPRSPQDKVGSCLREISLREEEKRERFPWLRACGMLGRSPTGRLSLHNPSRKLLEPETHFRTWYYLRKWCGQTGGYFSQMLAKACSGWGAFIARWRSTQVSPGSSSAQWPEEFIPVGSGTKRDVSSHDFFIRAVSLCPKNATSPCVSLPSFVYSPHFT